MARRYAASAPPGTPQAPQRIAEVVVGLRVVGIEFDRPQGGGFGFPVEGHLREHGGQVGISIGKAGIHPNRFPQGLRRLSRTVLGVEDQAEVE